MIQQRLYEWIKHPEMLNRDTLYELRTLLARYPYFQTARLLYLKNLFLLHDFSFGEELRKAALYVSDRRILFQLVEGERFSKKALEVHKALEMDMGLDRTMSLIDAFLSTLPEEEGPVYGKDIPMDVSTDYTAYLMQETPEEMMNKGRLFSLVTLQPGQSIGWHVHSGDSETYCILKGSGEYSDNGTLVTLGPGDVAMVRPGEGHSLLNTGAEPLELIALILYE